MKCLPKICVHTAHELQRPKVAMERNPTQIVLSLAVASRVLVATLFFLWRNVANPYDTSADLSLPCLSNPSFWASALEAPQQAHQQPLWGQRLGQAIQRTVVWDGVYYVRIAECGYEYEQNYAFLPALPLMMRFLSKTIFYSLIPVLGLRPTLAVSGYFIGNIAFVLAAYYLYRLSKQILEDEKQAVVAVALFCCNPASAFYSAMYPFWRLFGYSESLFTLFSFAGLWHFLNGARFTAIALFGLSSGVRSNGILHAGFILFQAMHKAYDFTFCQRRPLAVVPIILGALFQSAVVVAPYVAYQCYGFAQLCLHEGISEIRPWCSERIPHLYSFVQSYYWNVGFLRYFQFKQLPNFLLASPMLCLAVCGIVTYARNQPRLFFLLGLAASPSTRAKVALIPLTDSKPEITSDQQGLKETVDTEPSSNSLYNTERLRNRKGTQKKFGSSELQTEPSWETGFNSPGSICFLIQLCSMVATAAFVMHVQVASRFLSVSPSIYWYGAYLMSRPQKQKFGRILWAVFVSYVSLGSLLFINFYPFT